MVAGREIVAEVGSEQERWLHCPNGEPPPGPANVGRGHTAATMPRMKEEDIENRFTFHAGDEGKAHLHNVVRGRCAGLAHWLNETLPDGREKSTAITKLEEVMFWSNAAVARPALPFV